MIFIYLVIMLVQDLISQVSSENDPISLLAKVVSLLYVQVSSPWTTQFSSNIRSVYLSSRS